MMAAPSRTMARPLDSASPASKKRPPSENESGVTLRIPMTQGKASASEQEGVLMRRPLSAAALMREKTSARVAASVRKTPRTALVTV